MDTVEFMQQKIKEAHQIMKKVKVYLDEHTLQDHEGITIDYILFITILVARIGSLISVNAVLMIIAWFFPKPAVFLYLTLPIISFFKPEKKKTFDSKKENSD